MRKLSFIAMNLQLFAEEGGASGGVAAPQGTEGSSSVQSSGENTGSVTGTEGSSSQGTQVNEGVQGTEGTPSSGTESATQTKQTPEQNAAFAEMRRKAEAAEKRAMEIEAQRQRDIEIAKKYGQYGIYSDADVAEKYGKSHGLKTVADFEAQLQREEYQAKGIDPDMIKKLVDEHPAIKSAQQAQVAAAKAQMDRFLVDNFNDLTKEFSEIVKAEDVPADVWRLWRNGESGISLKQAYVAVNYESIASKKAEAAKQATLNNIQGKEHVRGNGKGSEVDTTTIPDEILEMYKKFNPGKSMDEYKAHYKASL
ncbi:MAG: hypothetical protein Q8911_00490 [Bacillota bacterium]|nr:hypothetical protein [Bacillota bacterium]